VTGSALAAAFPAVHPLAAVGVLMLFPHRRRRFDQILFLGKEVVGGVEHRAAESFGGEIEQFAKVVCHSERSEESV